MKVSILDYDAGNLASVYNCFYNLGASVKVINNYKDIKKAERLVVPGVGSAKYSIDYLNKNKMFNELKLFIETGRPILGICLGLQIFGKNLCEHGKSEGLGFIDADVKEISVKNKSIMSHIGWNKIDSNKELTKRLNIKENTYFYFCHSYSLNIYKKSKLDHHTNSSIKNKIEQYKVLENIFEYLNSLSNNSSLKNDEKINLKHDLKLVLNKIKSLKKEIKEIKNK